MLDLAPASGAASSLAAVPFAALLGNTTPVASRFTCAPADGTPLSAQTASAPQWVHTRDDDAGAKQQPLAWSDVAAGMLVGGLSTTPKSGGEMLLQAATRTWMQSTLGIEAFEVLLLADCGVREPMPPPTRATTPTWLAEAHPNSTRPRILTWCYYGNWQSTHGPYQKTAAMLQLLWTALPPKLFYLKFDSDTLLVPINLLRFLQFLHASVHAASPIYFGGSVYSLHRPHTVKASAQPETHHQLGHDCRHRISTQPLRKSERDCLMHTDGWRALEARQNWSDTEARVAHATSPITYAQGGAYGLSRAALRLAVHDDCVLAVGRLPCPEPPATDHKAPATAAPPPSTCGGHRLEDQVSHRVMRCPASLPTSPRSMRSG